MFDTEAEMAQNVKVDRMEGPPASRKLAAVWKLTAAEVGEYLASENPAELSRYKQTFIEKDLSGMISRSPNGTR
jgi:hypothetical protein